MASSIDLSSSPIGQGILFLGSCFELIPTPIKAVFLLSLSVCFLRFVISFFLNTDSGGD